MKKRKKTSNLKKLACPYCGNDKLYIVLDFKKKSEHVALCIKNRYKPSILRKYGKGKSLINGCGKEFRVFKNPKKDQYEIGSL